MVPQTFLRRACRALCVHTHTHTHTHTQSRSPNRDSIPLVTCKISVFVFSILFYTLFIYEVGYNIITPRSLVSQTKKKVLQQAQPSFGRSVHSNDWFKVSSYRRERYTKRGSNNLKRTFCHCHTPTHIQVKR